MRYVKKFTNSQWVAFDRERCEHRHVFSLEVRCDEFVARLNRGV